MPKVLKQAFRIMECMNLNCIFKSAGADPLTAFKARLDKFLIAIPDQPIIQGSAKTTSLVDQISYKC